MASMVSYWNYEPPISAAENTKPVHLAYGEADKFTSANYMQACYDAIGGPKMLVPIKDGSHQLMLYHTAEYVDIVDKWIREQVK